MTLVPPITQLEFATVMKKYMEMRKPLSLSEMESEVEQLRRSPMGAALAASAVPLSASLQEMMEKLQYNGQGLTVEDVQKYAPGGTYHRKRRG